MLAVGDVDVLKVIDEKDKLWALRKDEIGVLADSFNKVVESTSFLAAQTRAFADGDLTTDVTIRSEFDIQGKALDELVRRFRELTLTIIHGVGAGLGRGGHRLGFQLVSGPGCDDAGRFRPAALGLCAGGFDKDGGKRRQRPGGKQHDPERLAGTRRRATSR